MDITLTVNGFETAVHFDDVSVNNLFLPLLRKLTERQRKLGRRMVVFLAAPPGAGKSTLAAFLEHLSRRDPALTPLQALGLDGFHFHQDYILSHTVFRDGAEIPMRRVKGAPETFDVEKLRRTLAHIQQDGLRWPLYDRNLHDVVEDAIPVAAPILLIEGNWLLLHDPAWTSLPRDLSIFLSADQSLLHDRLVRRKIRGGLAPADAEVFYEFSDGPNVRRCLAESLPANICWKLDGNRHIPQRSPIMRYQAVVFDLDGTLVDSERLLLAAFTAAVEELGYPAPPPGHSQTILRGTNAQAMAYLNLEDIQPVVDCLLKHLGLLRHLADLFPGAAELVRGCKALGCRLGIVTSRCRREVDEDTALLPLLPLFDAIVTEEDTPNHKPHPEPLQRCLEKLGVQPSEAVYLGDTPTDAACAGSANVDFAHATWGADAPVDAKYAPAAPLDLLADLR